MNKLNRLTILLASTLILASCAHNDPIATHKVGLPGLVEVSGSGYKMTAGRYKLLLSHGVDSTLFYPYLDASYPYFVSYDNEPLVARQNLAGENKAK